MHCTWLLWLSFIYKPMGKQWETWEKSWFLTTLHTFISQFILLIDASFSFHTLLFPLTPNTSPLLSCCTPFFTLPSLPPLSHRHHQQEKSWQIGEADVNCWPCLCSEGAHNHNQLHHSAKFRYYRSSVHISSRALLRFLTSAPWSLHGAPLLIPPCCSTFSPISPISHLSLWLPSCWPFGQQWGDGDICLPSTCSITISAAVVSFLLPCSVPSPLQICRYTLSRHSCLQMHRPLLSICEGGGIVTPSVC